MKDSQFILSKAKSPYGVAQDLLSVVEEVVMMGNSYLLGEDEKSKNYDILYHLQNLQGKITLLDASISGRWKNGLSLF